ncbi:MAG: TonB family protein [Bdellovibrio bacteriovorus]
MSQASRESAPALPRALARRDPEAPALNLALALLGAGLLHLFLVLAISFELPKPGPSPTPDEALEVLILKDQGIATDAPAPDSVLSQRSRFGESNQGDAGITVTEAETAPPEEIQEPFDPGPQLAPEPEAPVQAAVEANAEAQPQGAPDSASSAEPVLETEPEPQADVLAAEPDPLAAPPAVDAAQILGSRDGEIARLEASLEARTAAYASRQRRKSVSASTREFRYASYLGAWARKVERIGNLNYPQAAKEQHLYGNLILHVAVRKDGSVEAIRVVRSSGHELLDQAAVNIVKLAAPYSPFPPEIAAETDVLDIVRTWQFQRGGKLGWEQ